MIALHTQLIGEDKLSGYEGWLVDLFGLIGLEALSCDEQVHMMKLLGWVTYLGDEEDKIIYVRGLLSGECLLPIIERVAVEFELYISERNQSQYIRLTGSEASLATDADATSNEETP